MMPRCSLKRQKTQTEASFTGYKKALFLRPMSTMRFLIVCAASIAMNVMGQNAPDSSQLSVFRFRNVGPAGMSGRITTIAVVNKQPNIIYAGAASGGIWKSDNGGTAWKPIFDKADVGSIGAIAIPQGNPAVVWAGTGEGNPRNSHTSGKGIY